MPESKVDSKEYVRKGVAVLWMKRVEIVCGKNI